ncbi:class I SAM-dependent methyltransferase [Aeromonas salmonicida]|uniref:class I SAM-dependent methyltransferase n=1 Tax=Aeromonas salmonicida TaxID=645 RepID=UPI003CFCDC25
MMNTLDTTKGARVYTPLTLSLYDAWVLGVSNRWAWRCPTKQVLLPFFEKHCRQHHLDVGVGSGFYLQHARWSQDTELTLLDMNQNSLQAAAKRAQVRRISMLQHDVMQPLPEALRQRYDSISLFYLLHCLPGSLNEKGTALSHLSSLLRPEGVLFGATILGKGVKHNRLGRKLMTAYNRKGIFHNHNDDLFSLQAELKRRFKEVDLSVEGTVALFSARYPKAA